MIHRYLTKQEILTQDIDEAKSYLEKLDAFDYKFKVGDYYLQQMAFKIFNQSLCGPCKSKVK